MMLTHENYYDKETSKEFMSCSLFKSFVKCPAKTMAVLNNKWEEKKSDALYIGSLLDRAVEGTVEEYIKENSTELCTKSSTKLGTMYAKYKIYEPMYKRLLEDDYCVDMLRGKKQVIGTSELFGVKWKFALDVENEYNIVDVKTTKSIKHLAMSLNTPLEEEILNDLPFIYGYYLQLSIYSRFKGNKDKYIVAVSKEKQPDIEVFSLNNDERSKKELAIVEYLMPKIIPVWKGKEAPEKCGICDYCKSIKRILFPIDVN